MKKAEKAIITCAVTGAAHMPCMSKDLPITPDEITKASVDAAEAGAAIIHLHARDPENGKPTTDVDVYGEFLPRIKQQCDAIINVTTGQPGTLDERLDAPKTFAPEICSFNMGPLNVGLWAMKEAFEGKTLHDWERDAFELSKDYSTRNTFADMERIAKELGEERGVRFEFECFDVGHLHNLRFIADRGWVKPPFFIQCVYGFVGGVGATAEHVLHMKRTADELFGDDYYWSNLATGKNQMGITTIGALLGGNVRVGMEDSLWLGKGVLARTNAEQVQRIRRILEELSIEIASPDEAREMLQTKGGDRVSF